MSISRFPELVRTVGARSYITSTGDPYLTKRRVGPQTQLPFLLLCNLLLHPYKKEVGPGTKGHEKSQTEKQTKPWSQQPDNS